MSLIDTFLSGFQKAGNSLFKDPTAWTPMFFTYGDRVPVTGQTLTQEDILYCSVVWRCINIIADQVATLPRDLFEKTGARSGKLALSHVVYPLVAGAPNSEMTKFDYDHLSVVNVCLWGAHYAEIVRDDRHVPRQLWPLDSTRVFPRRTKAGKLVFDYTYQDGRKKTFEKEDIHRYHRASLNGVQGVPICQAAMDAIALCKAFVEYAGRYFQNDATPPFVIMHDSPLSDKAKEGIRASFEKKHQGLKNRFRFAILDGGAKLQGLDPPTNRDSQLTEQQRLVIADIARFFGIPLHMLAELSRSTNNNIAQQNLEFKTNCLDPWLTCIGQAMARDLLKAEHQGRYYVEYDVDALLWADPETKINATTKLVVSGIIEVNEARAELGYDPHPHGGVLLLPTANAPNGVPMVAPQTEAKEEKPDEKEDEGKAMADLKQIQRAFEPLLADIAGRLVRRETVRLWKHENKLREGKADLSEFVTFAQDFYLNEHARDIEQSLAPSVRALALCLKPECAESEIKALNAVMVARIGSFSFDKVMLLCRGAGSAAELAELLHTELEAWQRERPKEIASAEFEAIVTTLGVCDAA